MSFIYWFFILITVLFCTFMEPRQLASWVLMEKTKENQTHSCLYGIYNEGLMILFIHQNIRLDKCVNALIFTSNKCNVVKGLLFSHTLFQVSLVRDPYIKSVMDLHHIKNLALCAIKSRLYAYSLEL